MKRTIQNLIVDSILMLTLVWLVSTGLLMYFRLPPGTAQRSAIWGLGRHEWGDVHFWLAISLLGVATIHFIFHWKWITGVVRDCIAVARQRVIFLAVIALFAAVSASLLFLSPVSGHGRGGGEGYRSGRTASDTPVENSHFP
jgi:hypothetical protein